MRLTVPANSKMYLSLTLLPYAPHPYPITSYGMKSSLAPFTADPTDSNSLIGIWHYTSSWTRIARISLDTPDAQPVTLFEFDQTDYSKTGPGLRPEDQVSLGMDRVVGSSRVSSGHLLKRAMACHLRKS